MEQTLGAAVKAMNAVPALGESMDEKTAATVVAAADIILDILPARDRLAFAALLRGVFALPVG